MPKLLMLKGLPASGKSTFAKALVHGDPAYTAVYGKNWKRVNKDDLRAMIDGGKWSKQNEKFILRTRDRWIAFVMGEGIYNIVVDDTNLSPKHEQDLSAMAVGGGYDFQIKDFTNVPLEECIKRDQNRPNYVGEKVIKSMYNSFLKEKPDVAQYTPPPFNPDLPSCIIVDIDGTLAHMDGRSPYDYSMVHTDVVDENVADIVRKYYARDINSDMPETYVIVVSGREDGCKQDTVDWLANNHIPYDEIFMRKHGDMRNDAIVKKEIYEEWIKPRYNVKFVLDDRDRVVKMWREEGLKVLQVGYGDF